MSVAGGMKSGCVLLGKHQKSGKFYWMIPKVTYPNQSGLEEIDFLAVHFCFVIWPKTGSTETKMKKKKEKKKKSKKNNKKKRLTNVLTV